MAWYKKKDICRIYIFIYIYIRKCIEHVWSTQSHPWHINSLGFNFQRATGNQPFGFNKQVIVCQFHLCAYVLTCTYICLAFKAKVLLLQTARVWHITDPHWTETKTGAHTEACTHTCGHQS